MPYINQRNRERIHVGEQPKTVGELNYAITRMIHRFIGYHGLSYTIINAVIGVLSCATMELYRMVAAPYEDVKKTENGSVSELDG